MMADYNVYEYNYDDDIDNKLNQFDSTIGFKIGKLMPMVGYTYTDSLNYIDGTFEHQTLKAGLRMDLNNNIAIIGTYKYNEDLKSSETQSIYKADIAFKF